MRSAVLLLLPLFAATVTAQDAEPARVMVGSYLMTEPEGPLPVTVYSANLLQRLGAHTPAEGLRLDPSAFGNTATENNSNGGDGSARLSLRGLGPRNTLTLINGRRAFSFSDLNAIPFAALDRAEILRDGAGISYSADAIAGTLNVILLNGPGSTPFNGVEFDLSYGNTTDKDARVLQAFVRGGFSNDKMALVFAAEYYDREGLFSRDREVSNTANLISRGGFNTGSATFSGRVTLGGSAASGGGPRILIDSASIPTGPTSYRAYGGSNSDDPYNFRLATPAIPAQEKYSTYVAGSYRLYGKVLEFYADALYSKTKQDNGLSPAPLTFSRAEALSSPFNPFGNFASPFAGGPTPSRNVTAVQYRLQHELGNRTSFYDADYWRYTVGLKGEHVFKNSNLIDYLSYDGGAVYERYDQLRTDGGDALRSVLAAEVAAGNFNPFIGLAAPVAGVAPTYNAAGVQNGTRPYDNAASARLATYQGRSFDEARHFLIDAKIAGNLFPVLPQGGLGFNVGMEFRQSRTQHRPDATQLQGDQIGFTAPLPATRYRQEVRSYFAEFSLPIVTPKMKVPLLSSLDLSLALRSEQYEYADQLLGGSFDPGSITPAFRPGSIRFRSGLLPRFTLRHIANDQITLRGSYGEGYRPPTPDDLFAPHVLRTVSLPSPIFPGNPAIDSLQGGNPRLRGEESKTWTAGLCLTPRFAKGLTLTTDYYQIQTRNVIVPSADLAPVLLLGSPSSNLVVRDPDTGLPIFLFAQNANTGKRLVTGLTSILNYQLPYDLFGQFTFSLGANYLFAWKAEPHPGVGSYSFLGNYNNGTQPLAPGAIPRLKGYFRTEWAWKGFQWTGTLNYVGNFKDDPSFVGVLGPNPRDVGEYVTFDMQLSYEFKRPRQPYRETVDGKGVRTAVVAEDSSTFAQRLLWGTKLRVGVVNLFDRSPPTVLGAFNDSYDTSLYSIRNRYVYVGLNKRF